MTVSARPIGPRRSTIDGRWSVIWRPKPNFGMVSIQGETMRRRDFIVGIAGLAAGWPHATRAQQNDQVRRMGLLMPYAMSNAEAQASSNALLHGLRELGWFEGRNLEVEYRFAGAGTEDLRGTPTARALQLLSFAFCRPCGVGFYSKAAT